MSTSNSSRDEADLEDFLARQSSVSIDYDNLELVEPSDSVDARILAAAKAAAGPAAKVVPAGPGAQAAPKAPPKTPRTAPAKDPPARRPEPVVVDNDDDEPESRPVRRPRWLVPAALAASVLAAVGIGFAVLDPAPSVQEDTGGLGSLFAKRARERSTADKAAAEAAAAEEAEVMVMEAQPPPPPPPFFEFDGPQVADLDAAIALIRRELIMASQREAQDEALSMDEALSIATLDSAGAEPAARSEAPASPAAASSGQTSVIQSRNRRLAKVLELYDTGNPVLAEDALEIFLRDFADDPISQRILGVKP